MKNECQFEVQRSDLMNYIVWALLVCLLLLLIIRTSNAVEQEEVFNYDVVNSTCILVNPLNTKILSGSGNTTLVFRYEQNITSLDNMSSAINAILGNLTHGNLTCNLNNAVVSANISSEFISELEALQSAVSSSTELMNLTASECGGCGIMLANCENRISNYSFKEDICLNELNFKEEELNQCRLAVEHLEKEKFYYFILVMICTLISLFFFLLWRTGGLTRMIERVKG